MSGWSGGWLDWLLLIAGAVCALWPVVHLASLAFQIRACEQEVERMMWDCFSRRMERLQRIRKEAEND